METKDPWFEAKVLCDSCKTKIRESRLQKVGDERWCKMCVKEGGDGWTR